MLRFITIMCWLLTWQYSIAQEIPATVEQQLETLADDDETETEDDSFLQQLEHFREHPLNLNTADAAELRELRIVTDLQINNLIAYRNLLGQLISIYELQAVPTWNIVLAKKLLPFISVSTSAPVMLVFRKRLSGGEHSMVVRWQQVLEKSVGYYKTLSGTKYTGSPSRIFFRYRYNYKNLLQYGVVGDKDAGEQFLKGRQRYGFDFYSFHFFAKKTGAIEALALGDFTVNLGQGLIHWQALSFKKSADALNIKRQSSVLKPYNVAGEYNFHRGIGITIKKKKIEGSAFVSLRKLSANYVVDTILNNPYISSIQTSGYHRTENENADKNSLTQLAIGGNSSYRTAKWHIGINGVYYKFSVPLQKRAEPYNKYAISGNNWYNASIDYSYTHHNLHVFGEAAIDKKFHTALVNGLLINLDAKVDLSLLHRSIASSYQSVYGNAFTENSYPTNESGLYAGISIRPLTGWKFDAYVDFFRFPWLKYLVDAPSTGTEYLAQLTYTPNRQLEIYTRYRNETKQANQSDNTTVTNFLITRPKQNWRTHISYKLNAALTIRNRVELLWFDRKGENSATGFLTYIDLLYRPIMSPLAATLRWQYFETDDYNSRIYAYENDVLYSYSIPALFEKGNRYYLIVNYDILRKLSIWLRFAQTIYSNINSIGSGLDTINGKNRSELKIQLRYLF